MTFDEAATTLAKLAFTTSDPGSVKIHKYCNGSSYEQTLLKEFIYAKAFIAIFICAEAANSNNIGEVASVKNLMFQKLKTAFEQDRFGYGNNYRELNSRFEQYANNVETFNNVTREYINCVGIDALMFSNLDPFIVVSIMEETRKWMSDNMDRAQNGRGSSCYVATATYQDAFHPNVILLRDFRDNYLQKSSFGRAFVKFYYTFGPYAAWLPEHFTMIRNLSKKIIDIIVNKIRKSFYE